MLHEPCRPYFKHNFSPWGGDTTTSKPAAPRAPPQPAVAPTAGSPPPPSEWRCCCPAPGLLPCGNNGDDAWLASISDAWISAPTHSNLSICTYFSFHPGGIKGWDERWRRESSRHLMRQPFISAHDGRHAYSLSLSAGGW